MSDEIDLQALQDNIDESQVDEPNKELDVDQENEQDEDPEFDLDAELDSFEPIELDGKITDDEATEKAKSRGWNPEGKDKYGHSVSAIEFLERTPLFHKMDLMRGDIDDIKKQNKKLVEQSKLIAKSAIDDKARMLNEFKEEKEKLLSTELLDKDDIDKLKTIDKQIEEHSVDTTQNDDLVADFEVAKDDFVEKNEWYNSNRAMTTLADSLGKKFAEDYFKEHEVLPEPDDLFNYVLDEVKKDFPDMGKPKRGTRVASRNNRTVQTTHKKGKTLDDIPEDQRAIAKMVMESAGLSEEEYLKNYEF